MVAGTPGSPSSARHAHATVAALVTQGAIPGEVALEAFPTLGVATASRAAVCARCPLLRSARAVDARLSVGRPQFSQSVVLANPT